MNVISYILSPHIDLTYLCVVSLYLFTASAVTGLIWTKLCAVWTLMQTKIQQTGVCSLVTGVHCMT